MKLITRKDILTIANKLVDNGFTAEVAKDGLWLVTAVDGNHAKVVEQLTPVLGDMSQFEVLQFGFGKWIVQPNIVPEDIDGDN